RCPSARLRRARRVAPRGDLGVRHVRDDGGDAGGRAQARARTVTAQDVGGCRRRSRGWAGRGAGVRSAGARPRRVAARALAAGDGGVGGGAGGAGGRRGRVAVQTRSGREGFLVAHPGSRRRARSARFTVLRTAAHGRSVPPVRGCMSLGVAILGSTGSIGCSTLQVLGRQRERFRVAALTAYSNAELLERQAAEWKPAYVGLVNSGKRETGKGKGKGNGAQCLVEAATHPDVQIVVNAIVGAAGLEETLAAL